ncbi:MAG: phage/plasmid primase, P4 family [Candidatus Omnitrophica bacterium]|nr:phage/plasmid primase, P4 family [Candidatus Omnitrophota bacterium]
MNNENMNKEDIYNDVKKEINPVKVASKIALEHNIIFCGNNFYEYQDGRYQLLNDCRIFQWIKIILGDFFNPRRTNEIIHSLKADRYIDINELNKSTLLNLKNGVFDLDTFQLKPHSPDIYSTIQLEVNYDPNAKCPKWEKSVEEIFENKQVNVHILQEFFGLCLTRETKYEKALFCIGEGANGKSTLLEILMNILGKSNYSAVPLEKFDNLHYIANLYSKLANITIETYAKSDIYDSRFKAIVSGDVIEADCKFQKPFTFQPFCKLIIALNNMPRSDDKTSAFFRRLIILRFNRVFTETEQNKNLKKELLSELDGIFLWCLSGLERLRKRGYFELNKEIEQEIFDYKRENNNVIVFVEEECQLDPNCSSSKDSLYAAYAESCRRSGYKALSKLKFGKELKKQFNTISEDRTEESRNWIGIDTTLNISQNNHNYI